jgi:hypothetical protein
MLCYVMLCYVMLCYVSRLSRQCGIPNSLQPYSLHGLLWGYFTLLLLKKNLRLQMIQNVFTAVFIT